jgi:aminoglycoside phosphotransferase family enzyme/predicted kinase
VVLLLGDRAFKVKKPVRLPFVDLSTRERRWHNCVDEVRLNRRFAPDVYLGLAELRGVDIVTAAADADAVVGPGAAGATGSEPLVVMRRMPAARRLSALLLQGDHERASAAVDAVARQVATAHAAQPAIQGFALRETMSALWREGREQLSGFADLLRAGSAGSAGPHPLDEVAALAQEYLAGRAALLAARERAGLVRDGHGDLLADDVFVLDDGPRILDCLEFDPRLRVGDVLADVAFLAMDLESLGFAALAGRLMDGYRRYCAETHPLSLEHHYVAYRAFVRAKVACLRHEQGDAAAAARAVDLLAQCRRRLHQGRVHLLLVGGLPGSGKSTLAAGLADSDADRQWAVVSSDHVRKEGAGVPAGQSCAAPFGRGIYTAGRTAATYAEMSRRAAATLDAGVSVVLDASWTDERLRARARALAAAHGAALTQIRCHAPRPVRLDRLARRLDAPADASDAGVAVHDAMADREDPWPQARTVRTDRDVDLSVAQALELLALRPLAGAPSSAGSHA